jgi:uncharacterized coiled-coil DUF342 family protein
MNPLKGIEEWIKEHGSASILRDHVSLLKEKMAGLESKTRALEKQVSDFASERDAAQAEVKKLQEYIRKHQRPYKERRVSHIPI